MRAPTPPRASARRASMALAAALTAACACLLAVAAPAAAASTIPDPIAIIDGAQASPYPSTITVSGLGTVVTGVEVTLTGLTHTFPDDLYVMLQGPHGEAVVLTSGCGGNADAHLANMTFTATGSPLSDTTAFITGTYRPTACQAMSFPAPAPATAGSDLSVFTGTDPNGTWGLYIYDSSPGDVGTIGTWSLNVRTVPTARAGGPYVLAEGAALTLDASGSTASAAATYAWDLDADGAYDDATGTTPTLTHAALAALGLGDGPAGPLPVSLQVTDGAVATASTTLNISATAPIATLTLPAQAVAGTAFTMEVGAVDPSPADAAATFTYEVDWTGDGVADQTLTGPADPPVTHTYAAAGTYRITVWATDRDGARSAPLMADLVVQAAPPTSAPPTSDPPTAAPPTAAPPTSAPPAPRGAPGLADSGGVTGAASALAAIALGTLLLAASRRLRTHPTR